MERMRLAVPPVSRGQIPQGLPSVVRQPRGGGQGSLVEKKGW